MPVLAIKAVPVHAAHYRQRTSTGKFVPFKIKREAPRDTSGRFVRRLEPAECAEAKRLAGVEQGRLARDLQQHWSDLHEGGITVEQATERGKTAITEYYERIFRLAMQSVGNPALLLTPRDKAAISRMARDEGDYWAKFMQDGANGRTGAPGSALDPATRLAAYKNATSEAYWLGWTLGDMRQNRTIEWVIGATEQNCGSCLNASKQGKMSVERFYTEFVSRGILPQSGELDCKGIHCDCSLKESVA